MTAIPAGSKLAQFVKSAMVQQTAATGLRVTKLVLTNDGRRALSLNPAAPNGKAPKPTSDR